MSSIVGCWTSCCVIISVIIIHVNVVFNVRFSVIKCCDCTKFAASSIFTFLCHATALWTCYVLLDACPVTMSHKQQSVPLEVNQKIFNEISDSSLKKSQITVKYWIILKIWKKKDFKREHDQFGVINHICINLHCIKFQTNANKMSKILFLPCLSVNTKFN